MTDEPETTYDKPRQFRAPDAEWIPFDAAVRAAHPDGPRSRARILREFMRWYLRRPGSQLPQRPPAGPWSTPPAIDAQTTNRS
ncbi:hypothetical protein [Streptomyces sp. CAU 1734]|uniref:hypothetical protein n=1 Tax=Streptomyces sp. CAU 1734 TaxID=3140360 RepID=UPI0032608AEE